MAMVPLDKTEMVELRAWAESDVNNFIEALRVQRLLDEVERSRVLLKRIEWNGVVGECPSCSGDRPVRHLGLKDWEEGHKADCELNALLRS